MNYYLKYFSIVIVIALGAFYSLGGLAESANTLDSLTHPEQSSKSDISEKHQAYLGLWQTIDDDTKQPRSLVLITIRNQQLSAEITKVYPVTGEPDDPVCKKCKGKLKNAKIIGLNILKDMDFEKGVWQGGEILDPSNGKFYDAKIWIEKDQLQVRGYIGFFYRTQQWLRFSE